jgi:hypothetical protein
VAQRVLAVLGAVAVVFVAIVVRSAIDDGGDADEGDGSRGGSEEVVVVCDLAPACDGLGDVTLRNEAAASTALHLVEGTLTDADVLVTTSAWAEVLEARAPDAIAEVRSLASSPAVVATLPDRSGAIESACGAEPLWRCLGSASGRPWSELGGEAAWGRISIGITDPDRALGLPVLASVAAGYFGVVDFASNDFDDDFRSWLGALSGDASRSSPVREMVTAQGSFSAAGSVRARAAEEAGVRSIETLDPSPPVTAIAVAIRLRGGELPDLGPVVDALADAGWQPSDDPGAPAPTFKPGVMAALHTLWTEVAR